MNSSGWLVWVLMVDLPVGIQPVKDVGRFGMKNTLGMSFANYLPLPNFFLSL